ncbi:expressed unknown protein [Seminavis robusta]|uniref:Uncharacterized protein n=1 Tax=Seminavis robusta TaxID=568900 RepID=A0A9N8DFC5_9STRA|nr:expressed unknown protein [Seminavis robusta]|eukprot:Sro98_g050300.1 n/a (271) ;mRNA; r:17458-18270
MAPVQQRKLFCWSLLLSCLTQKSIGFTLDWRRQGCSSGAFNLLPKKTQRSSNGHPTTRLRAPGKLYYTNYEDQEYDNNDIGEDRVETDWWQAELTLLNAPTEPSPDLSAEAVAVTCIRSLQWVDYPTPLQGLRRCFPFLTYGCREVATARRGGKTLESFVEFGLYSPALQPFIGAAQVCIGDCTYTPAKAPLRGALASFPVQIHGAPVLAVQHLSGMERSGIAPEPPVTHMVIRLEQQRRPPNQHCWLVTEIMDVRHAFAGDMGNAHVGG